MSPSDPGEREALADELAALLEKGTSLRGKLSRDKFFHGRRGYVILDNVLRAAGSSTIRDRIIQEVYEWRTSCMSALERTADLVPVDDEHLAGFRQLNMNTEGLSQALGVLAGLKAELENRSG